MNKILVNQEDHNVVVSDFPMLIHGEEGSGASLCAATTAVNLFSRRFHIVFLCGYPQAEEEFKKQSNGIDCSGCVTFYTKENFSDFKESLINTNNKEIIYFVKNIELFGRDVLDLVLSKNKIVISGNIGKSICAKQILNTKFNTKILFSILDGVTLPALQKYEGFLMSNNLEGAARVIFA